MNTSSRRLIKKSFVNFLQIFLISLIVSFLLQMLIFIYTLGYQIGFIKGQQNINIYYQSIFQDLSDQSRLIPTPTVVTKNVIVAPEPSDKEIYIKDVDWGGPDLWTEVNVKRQQYGVNPLNQADELCTIASIRLNELLSLGKLDGHEGFGKLSEEREDLKWIFEKYSAISEFLAAGASSAQGTVDLWDNTLSHKKLLTGGEYVWGCIYAQNSFAVAIAAY
jgi:uncharacterized protein YkwD